jgi:hypothetical protein
MKGWFFPGAGIVDTLGNQLLAGAGLAIEKDGGVCLG